MPARLLVLCLLLLPRIAGAQGFATLGDGDGDFAAPVPGTALTFPRDHGPHPEFRVEWWYVTATLTGADGRDYGVQWTLFRTALRPGGAADDGWSSPQIWLGHAALTSARAHRFAERRSRGGIGTAGVRTAPFEAWIDDWRMQGRAAPGADALSALDLTARGDGFRYALALDADGPLVLHGQDGYSIKSPNGQASFYYSQPNYRVTGSVETADGTVAVTGRAWLDREWSSQPLSRDQQGWDWMALDLDTGEKLMAARVRGGNGDFVFGSWIGADGRAEALTGADIVLTPGRRERVAGRSVPVRWRVEMPARGLDIEIAALNPDSWMGTTPPYWEGPVRVTGSHGGRGYLEMTGYAARP